MFAYNINRFYFIWLSTDYVCLVFRFYGLGSLQYRDGYLLEATLFVPLGKCVANKYHKKRQVSDI